MIIQKEFGSKSQLIQHLSSKQIQKGSSFEQVSPADLDGLIKTLKQSRKPVTILVLES